MLANVSLFRTGQSYQYIIRTRASNKTNRGVCLIFRDRSVEFLNALARLKKAKDSSSRVGIDSCPIYQAPTLYDMAWVWEGSVRGLFGGEKDKV